MFPSYRQGFILFSRSENKTTHKMKMFVFLSYILFSRSQKNEHFHHIPKYQLLTQPFFTHYNILLAQKRLRVYYIPTHKIFNTKNFWSAQINFFPLTFISKRKEAGCIMQLFLILLKE